MKSYAANARVTDFARDVQRIRESHSKQMRAILELDVIPGLDRSIDYKVPPRFISDAEYETSALSLVVQFTELKKDVLRYTD